MTPQIKHQEACPFCKTQHTIGEYQLRKQGGKDVFGPPDVDCSCGMKLRWVVPLFRTTASGCELQPVPVESERSEA